MSYPSQMQIPPPTRKRRGRQLPGRMHRLSSPARSLLSVTASAPTHRGLAGRLLPLPAAPRPLVRCVSRFFRRPRNVATISRVKGDESTKSYTRSHDSSANFIIYSQDNRYSGINHGMKYIETKGTISQLAGDERGKKDAYRTTSEFIYVKRDTGGQTVNHTGCEEHQMSKIEDHRGKLVSDDEDTSEDENDYPMNNILAKSRHRDGSIYRSMDIWWKKQYRIADRNETRVEAMMFSDPTNCIIRDGIHMRHGRGRMLQILSLEIAEISLDGDLVELYGYIAVRDDLDPLLNYIVNFSRDDPIVVEQGSLISMAGPKRGIDFFDQALIEYDMRIKTSEHEKDDLQLIDGASLLCPPDMWDCPFTCRIRGDGGTIKLTLARLNDAVEATVEVLISEVQKSFNLSVGCLTSGLDNEIRLFNGAIMESHPLKRWVVSVMMDYSIDLKFNLGALSSSSEQHFCSFKAKTHGHDAQEIKTCFGLISVKVTWSTMLLGHYAAV